MNERATTLFDDVPPFPEVDHNVPRSRRGYRPASPGNDAPAHAPDRKLEVFASKHTTDALAKFMLTLEVDADSRASRSHLFRVLGHLLSHTQPEIAQAIRDAGVPPPGQRAARRAGRIRAPHRQRFDHRPGPPRADAGVSEAGGLAELASRTMRCIWPG